MKYLPNASFGDQQSFYFKQKTHYANSKTLSTMYTSPKQSIWTAHHGGVCAHTGAHMWKPADNSGVSYSLQQKELKSSGLHGECLDLMATSAALKPQLK